MGEGRAKLQKPIIILGMPRSGTSMVAGLFHLHGCWVGRTRVGNEKNPRGYFENTAFKRYFQAKNGRDLIRDEPIIPPDRREFDEFVDATLKNEDYQGGPWIVKFSALWWRYFEPYEPFWVLVRRPKRANVEACMVSGLHNNANDKAGLELSYDQHHREMDSLPGFNVYTQDVVAGDYSSLQIAIEGCGLNYDEEIVRKFVDKKFWHHRS